MPPAVSSLSCLGTGWPTFALLYSPPSPQVESCLHTCSGSMALEVVPLSQDFKTFAHVVAEGGQLVLGAFQMERQVLMTN